MPEPTKKLKVLHKTIKKVEDDIEPFFFQYSGSAFIDLCKRIERFKIEPTKPVLGAIGDFNYFLHAPHIGEVVARN